MKSTEAGTVLLEAIVALSILGAAGIALAIQVQQTARSVDQIYRTERRVQDASMFLDAVALWTPTELNQRLGDRFNSGWRLSILRRGTALFDVAVRDSGTDAVLVATTLYRLDRNDKNDNP